ncbi:hypothetical protein BCR32DRAFT_247195 [Anaeromyces robustus]|jgi:hypothetical protein|uniref:SET domain-containing protein n=1 Tax=Anaeromyces robustus TaxID=1754192 RepID=A0A1Y1WXU1_9FUNG|nr:hypothetical protein BCR32DRAFT_247195 [Anaeromyces robustus]|eukprot:ORX78389.1 hypothetical protein BCR32DRAFT_247195 [Anaeromyces robustus]
MARGENRVLKNRNETRRDKREKQKLNEKKDEEVKNDNIVKTDDSGVGIFTEETNKKIEGTLSKIIVKVGCITLMLYVWIFLFTKKYYPYRVQNQMLIDALQDPELIRHTVKVSYDYQEFYNKYMEEHNQPQRIHLLKRVDKDTVPTDEEVKEKEKEPVYEVDEDEVPIAKERKSDILPEDEADVEVVGDMKEEIMGGEIYTVDEIFEKLGIEKISDYQTYSEYEKNLLKEFRLDREMPENVAKKADYYKQIIERGLKEGDERFFVKKINDKKGYGLFAKVDIVANEVLGVYTGVIQSTDSEKGKKFEWYYSTIPDRKLEKMVELRVNGKNKGSALRFVNHSIFYNSRIEYVPYNNQWYILFITNRYINRGEEITVDYRKNPKRMPEKILDKWDKVEEEELQKLYDEYMKLKAQSEQASTKEEKKASAKEL